MYSGNSAQRVDIVLLPEGYGAASGPNSSSACRTFADEFFSYSPYKENAARFKMFAPCGLPPTIRA